MSWVEAAKELAPKVNWPAAFIVVAALALYAFVLAPDYVTKDDLDVQTEELKQAIQQQSTADAVHDTTIETIHRVNDRQDADIRHYLGRSP